MPRATNAPASRERRKTMVSKAKGYRGRRSKLFRYAKDARMKAQVWATRDRKTRKRTLRGLWITRINAGARQHGISYSQCIYALRTANITLNRKMLADLAARDPQTFTAVVEKAKAA